MNVLIDIDIDIDISMNIFIDIDIDIDIFKSDLIDIDIFKTCRYIDNRYGLSIYRTSLTREELDWCIQRGGEFFSKKTADNDKNCVWKIFWFTNLGIPDVLRALNLLYNRPPERVLFLKQKGRWAKFWSRSQFVCSGEVDWVQYIRAEVTGSKLLLFLIERFIGYRIYF